jgi:RNase H-fold protein (predicted Holliday junction resolvase)
MFAGDSREVVYEDETLTTAMAAGYQRERGEKGKRDDLAAMAILQGYFDRYGRLSS